MMRTDGALAVCRNFNVTDSVLAVCKSLEQEGISLLLERESISLQPYNPIPASIGELEVCALSKATSAQLLLGSHSFA